LNSFLEVVVVVKRLLYCCDGGGGHVTTQLTIKNLNSEPDSLLKIKNSFIKQLGNEIYNFEFMPRGGGD
jgi:hypothetical protein